MAVGVICLLAAADIGFANDNNGLLANITGESTFRYGYMGVNGDEGRFREDNWRTDQSTGGLDRLHMESKEPDEWGHKWYLDGRAIYDYDYLVKLFVEKEDNYYLKLEFDSRRRYYDGSNEYWNTALYGLTKRFAELPDSDYFVDRRNYTIEMGLTPDEEWEFIFGWTRQEKDGKEVLLFGGLTQAGGQPNFRGIPSINNVRGISDTVYGEAARTFFDKYNFRLRQEWEQYRDTGITKFGMFQPGVDSYETFQNDPGFTDWRTLFTFDSFLDEETYVTVNYMYDYLNNDGTRNVFLPQNASTDLFTDNNVGASRRSNIVALGTQHTNVLPNLHYTGSLRVDDSRTNSRSSGMESGSLFLAMSQEHDRSIGKNITLTYDGFKRTILDLEVDLELREVDWDENNDGERYRTDVTFTDQEYKFTGIHRFNRKVKTTFAYGYSNKYRDYNVLINETPGGYPGWIDNYRRKEHDISLKTDWRINRTTTATVNFQYLQEGITTKLGNKTQNREVYRGSGSLSSSPIQNLFLVGTFMLENYQLNTPAVGDSTFGNIAGGATPYDFRGNYFSILLDGTYALNEKTSCTFGYRHTEGLSTVDYGGDYALDTVNFMVNHKLAENHRISAGYEMYHFNNHEGGNFDDYTANGAVVTYTFTF